MKLLFSIKRMFERQSFSDRVAKIAIEVDDLSKFIEDDDAGMAKGLAEAAVLLKNATTKLKSFGE